MAESKIALNKPNMAFANFDDVSLERVQINEEDIDDTNLFFTNVINQDLGKLPIKNYAGYLITFRREATVAMQFYTRVTSTNSVIYMRKCQSGTWQPWTSITFS